MISWLAFVAGIGKLEDILKISRNFKGILD